MEFMLIFNQIYVILWYLIPFFILIIFLKSSWFKGVFGEFIVNLSAKLFLDKNKYHLIKNVTLPTEDGSTQIDHTFCFKVWSFCYRNKEHEGLDIW